MMIGINLGFEDAGNARKSVEKHDVSQAEAEQICFNEPLVTVVDTRHSDAEARMHALGHTDDGRLLHVTFTLRGSGSKIRVISARNMSRRGESAMTNIPKPVPTFRTEAEERAFWETHDSDLRWRGGARRCRLKPSSTSISLRPADPCSKDQDRSEKPRALSSSHQDLALEKADSTRN